ncbi:glycosyltransferase [Salinibacterium sp. SWN139]|uniref:glycosyltransferase n=1 Tax=Salinibacterium sp. SWN139 TaxID=2792055 RepID=UPI0018CFEBF6|nr:glycosyltransferase [Salinibacterium sp. SWN139]MBH0053566.1 glycosyltransferase [Salinibacterium sp. SWN139]
MILPSPLATVIQRAVFPQQNVEELLPLYVDAPESNSVELVGRHSVRVRAGHTVSLATYFNGFPAGYWQHWTTVQSVTARLSASGNGAVRMMRSDDSGEARVVETRSLRDESSYSFELSLAPFVNGGWYWIDIVADSDVLLSDLVWSVTDAPVTEGKVSLGITTFNKPDYCVETLKSLASSSGVLPAIDKIFIVDQGTKRVMEQAGYDDVAAALGEQLKIVHQPNLGGSGGFARGMIETLDREDSAFVMLLDDDVELEPESILRAVWFARYCVSPTIVGGHMLDLGKRSVLHAFAEVVDRGTFMWGPADRNHERHDFAQSSLRDTPWLHQRQDGDFNGWWMCLIPSQIIREIGLSLPVFIKWDDAEYGLRAQSAGFPTVSLPGAALWHVSWVDKDDTIDWQAYFHARNRLIVALLHSSDSSGAGLLREYRKLDIKHLISFQYYPATLRNQAFKDVLAGPEKLHDLMPTALQNLRTQAADFAEMQHYSADTRPRSRDGKQSYPASAAAPVGNIGLALFTAKALVRHWFRKTPEDLHTRPHVELGKRDATWWRIPLLDSVLVDTADGSAASWYVRDRATFRALLVESFKLNRQLSREWKSLRKQYREHAASLTSVEAWSRTIER